MGKIPFTMVMTPLRTVEEGWDSGSPKYCIFSGSLYSVLCVSVEPCAELPKQSELLPCYFPEVVSYYPLKCVFFLHLSKLRRGTFAQLYFPLGFYGFFWFRKIVEVYNLNILPQSTELSMWLFWGAGCGEDREWWVFYKYSVL